MFVLSTDTKKKRGKRRLLERVKDNVESGKLANSQKTHFY